MHLALLDAKNRICMLPFLKHVLVYFELTLDREIKYYTYVHLLQEILPKNTAKKSCFLE
jgi:hypothetical protein